LKKGEPICKIIYITKYIINNKFWYLFYLDAFEPHKSAVTQMYYEEESRILITASKDKSVRVKIKIFSIY
jgi:hypothetical protein